MSGYIIGPCGVANAAVVGGTTFAVDPLTTGFSANTTSSSQFYAPAMPALQAGTLFVIAIVGFTAPHVVTTVHDATAGIFYTLVSPQDLTANTTATLAYAYYSSAQSAGNAVTIDFTTAPSNANWNFAGFTGASSAQLDGGASFTQGGTSTPTWNTSVPQTLAVGAIGSNSATTTASNPGWVIVGNTGSFDALAYKISTAANLSGDTLGGGTGYYVSALTAFK